jgi:hypothetical protein
MDEGVQQQPGEARTVLPAGMQPTVLSEGAMGIVVHLQTTEIRKQSTIPSQPTQKVKTEILDWKWTAGQKVRSGTVLGRFSPWAKYEIYRGLSPLSNGYSHNPNWSAVQKL